MSPERSTPVVEVGRRGSFSSAARSPAKAEGPVAMSYFKVWRSRSPETSLQMVVAVVQAAEPTWSRDSKGTMARLEERLVDRVALHKAAEVAAVPAAA